MTLQSGESGLEDLNRIIAVALLPPRQDLADASASVRSAAGHAHRLCSGSRGRSSIFSHFIVSSVARARWLDERLRRQCEELHGEWRLYAAFILDLYARDLRARSPCDGRSDPARR